MKREEEQREAARSAKMTKEEKRQMRLKKRQQELKVRPLNCLLIMEHLYEETSATTCFDEILLMLVFFSTKCQDVENIHKDWAE